jgi:perosamine synthetase
MTQIADGLDLDQLRNARLAILGGPKTVPSDEPDLFAWPIVTAEDEQAVLEVLRAGKMSGTGLTMEFEKEFAAWQGTKYALAHCNGTAALLAAMYGCGIGRGDEIICPSMTYWASALPVFALGGTVEFADIDPDSLCIDPDDIEHRITPRTKAIVVVHYCGHPCDMDPIMAIAERRRLKVIEDVSHAHGTRYKGRLCGALGHVGAMSMMAGKSFAIGEGGMLCTDDPVIWQRAMAFGHYERTNEGFVTLPELAPFNGLPLGGYKFRINQTCSAMGRVQLKHYDQRIAEIQRAINRFWDLLEGVPGLRAHRPAADSGSTMGGWYNPLGHYRPEDLGGLPVARFIDAVKAEGGRIGRGCNLSLHLHPVFNSADVYGDGRPTRVAFAKTPHRQPPDSLPVTEALADRCFGIPWFKHDRPDSIARQAAAFAKVALNADSLLR